MNSELKKKALTKLLIYWKEAIAGRTASTFYSYDKPRDLQNQNHFPGMKRLEKLLESYKGKYLFAIIYENTLNNTGGELRRYNSK